MKNENHHEWDYEKYNSNELFETVYYLSIGQYDLNDAFNDYCYKLCEIMFNHGLRIGGFSKRLIEDIFKDNIQP